MNSKLFLLMTFAATFCFTKQSFCQTKFEVPTDVEFKTQEDYAKYEPQIIDAAKWLEETDLNKETSKRKDANAFVLMWLTGTSVVSINIDEALMKLYGKNTDLLGIYLASYSRHILENKKAATKFTATKAAITSMINVYKKGISIKKSKEMENVIKLDDGQLDNYIIENFKIAKT